MNVIISKMFLIYFISYGCNGGALVFLGGAEASASPSFALPMFITIKKIIILHLFLGVPAATVGGTGTPWHTRGYAPGMYTNKSKPFTIPIIFMTKRSCFHCWKRNKSSDCSSAACAHLSILPSQCSLFIIIIKTTGQTYEKTHCSV